jgi:DNA-3-methyladenine glycosylase
VRPLQADWFAQDAMVVAPQLLGATLRVVGADDLQRSGVITEVEAYTADDPASHSFRGRTARNASMFGPPGHWYVYLIYGIHHCLNVVTGPVGDGQAVLIRSLHWVRGPGRLTAALGVDRRLDGARCDITLGDEPIDPACQAIHVTPRIGITRAADWPRRFVLGDVESS